MEEIVEFANNILVEEHGRKIKLHEKLIDSGVDSFGITVVFMEINAKYDVYSHKELDTLLIIEITMQDVVDRIQNDSN